MEGLLNLAFVSHANKSDACEVVADYETVLSFDSCDEADREVGGLWIVLSALGDEKGCTTAEVSIFSGREGKRAENELPGCRRRYAQDHFDRWYRTDLHNLVHGEALGERSHLCPQGAVRKRFVQDLVQIMGREDATEVPVFAQGCWSEKGLVHGYVEAWYPSGNAAAYGETLSGGRMNGLWRVFQNTGELLSIAEWKDGRLDGIRKTFSLAGAVQSEEGFREGKKHGLHTEWYHNGGKKFEKLYDDDVATGIWKFWYPSGALQREERYRNGEPDGPATEHQDTGGEHG